MKLLYSILASVIGFLAVILVNIGTDWVRSVNADRDILRQLQFKDRYLNGEVSAAPVALPKK